MLKYQIKFIALILFMNIAFADKVAVNSMDEAVLISCQTTGHTLYYNCVAKPPTSPDEVAACTALKIKYLVCLTKLTIPYPLTPSLDPDPYSYSPFTPCKFETGHLILFDICPNIP